jgi:hypothetical protein
MDKKKGGRKKDKRVGGFQRESACVLKLLTKIYPSNVTKYPYTSIGSIQIS